MTSKAKEVSNLLTQPYVGCKVRVVHEFTHEKLDSDQTLSLSLAGRQYLRGATGTVTYRVLIRGVGGHGRSWASIVQWTDLPKEAKISEVYIREEYLEVVCDSE